MKLSVFSLALPIFFETVGVHLIALVQSILSAHYEGGFFVTPTTVAGNTVSLLISVSNLLTTGMAIVLSISIGRGAVEDGRDIVGTTFISYSLFRFVVFTVAFFLAGPLMAAQGLTTEENAQMFSYAVTYFKGLCVINALMGLMLVFTGALRCYGYTKVGLYANVSSSATTAVLTFIALYLIKVEFEVAIYYLIGISAVASLVNGGVTVISFLRYKIPFRLTFKPVWLKETVKVGFPATVSIIMYSLSSLITAAICVYLSNDMFLARTYVSGIVFFTYSLGYAIGQANSIMVGRGCGMGKLGHVDAMFRQNLKITLAVNFTLSLVVALAGKYVLLVYTRSPSIIAIGSIVFFIDIAVELGRGMNHLGQYGLNATGDTIYTTVVSVVSCWVCSVGIGYLLGVTFSLGVYGLWIASAVDELFRGTLYYVRWRKGKWKERFVLDKAEHA